MLKLDNAPLHPNVCITENGFVDSKSFLAHVSAAVDVASSFGPRVVLHFTDSYAFAVSFFATLIAKREVILLPNTQPGTLERFVSEYDSVWHDQNFSLAMGDLEKDFFLSEDAPVSLYTSGSSGNPKKVSKRLGGLLNEVKILESTFGSFVAESLVLSTASHQHIYGLLFKVLWPTLCGRTWVVKGIEYPEHIERIACEVKSIALISTPAFLKRYVPGSRDITNCSAVFSSGGALDFDAAETVYRHLRVFPFEIYGSTETGGIAYRRRDKEDVPWAVFDGIQLSTDTNGQLVVESSYFEEPRVVLGDRAELNNGTFRLLGRSDDVVKIEDKRVSLSELSARLSRNEFVKEAAATSFEQNGRQQIGCAVVLSAAGEQYLSIHGERAITENFREFLRTYFEAVVLPRKFKIVTEIPYNERSKIVRNQLAELFS